jgi:hypothetical protein
MSNTTVTREAGNVYVGDTLYLPGDVLVTVTKTEWIITSNDLVSLSTDGGRVYTYRFSDTVEVVL